LEKEPFEIGIDPQNGKGGKVYRGLVQKIHLLQAIDPLPGKNGGQDIEQTACASKKVA